MRSHECPAPIRLGLGLLLNMFMHAYAHPAVEQYGSVVQVPQMVYETGFAGEQQPYVRFEPQHYIYQTGDLSASDFDSLPDALTQVDEPRSDFNGNDYMTVPENEKTPSKDEFLNGIHSLLVDKEKDRPNNIGRSKDEDDKGTSVDPAFYDFVYSTMLRKEEQNLTDHNTARDSDRDLDPSFLNQIRAAILHIIKQEHADAQRNLTSYVTDMKSNSSMYQSPQMDYESGYVFHPASPSLMQPNFDESMLYNDNPNVYADHRGLFVAPPQQIPVGALPISRPTQTLPTKPSETSQPLIKPGKPMYGPPSAAFGSSGLDSFYLQPMYQAPVPVAPMLFQYWPTQYSDANRQPLVQPVDWKDENSQKVDTKPSETNLTKYDIDPVAEKKKAHFTSRGGGKEKKINSNTQYRSGKNAVSARSVPEYNDDLPEGPSQKNTPLLKKVLIPLSPTENRISSNRIEQKEPVKPRYKVLYHLEKTYVPI